MNCPYSAGRRQKHLRHSLNLLCVVNTSPQPPRLLRQSMVSPIKGKNRLPRVPAGRSCHTKATSSGSNKTMRLLLSLFVLCLALVAPSVATSAMGHAAVTLADGASADRDAHLTRAEAQHHGREPGPSGKEHMFFCADVASCGLCHAVPPSLAHVLFARDESLRSVLRQTRPAGSVMRPTVPPPRLST